VIRVASSDRGWRWFCSPGTGRAVVREELDSLPVHGQAALTEAIRRFRRGEARPGEVSKLEDCKGLLEIRARVGHNQFRVVFFAGGPDWVCVLAVRKNQRRLPRADLDRALARMAAWKKERRKRGA
jgi:phage-related protein